MNLQTEAWTPAATAGIGFSRNRDGRDWAAILKDEARPQSPPPNLVPTPRHAASLGQPVSAGEDRGFRSSIGAGLVL
jgi:hypothetical protein